MIRPALHIAQMTPYALADMAPPPGKSLISLAQNESLRPPDPMALRAAAEAVAGSANYPDPDWTALRRALADLHDLDAGGVLCGAGSLELIGCIARVFAGPDKAVLAPAHAYPFFRTAAQMAGARFDTAAERNLTVSVDALLDAVQPDTGIVFVANPGNPTGTHIPGAELRRLRAALRPDILLVIDEAYGEFADHLGPRTFDMTRSGNTVVLRTFSKAYGMAGFRVGWGLFPPAVATEIRKVMNPNNIPAASQAAAVAAVKGQTYMRETCAETAALRDGVAARLQGAGYAVIDSLTNFLLLDLGDGDAAMATDAGLRAEGIFLRRMNGAGLSHTLRMTIGTEASLRAAVTVLETLKERGAS